MALIGRINWRYTFVLDLVLFVLLLTNGVAWLLALVLTEALFWMVRLIWISPVLLRFILRRLGNLIPVLLFVLAVGFGLIQLAPGDVYTEMALNPDIQPSDLEEFRENFGLNQPWYEQFFRYIWNALHGDFGFSEIYKAPVFALVSQRAAATILLSLTTILLAWGASVPFGIIAATKQFRWQDQLVSVLAFIGLAIPNFFLAFLFLYFISTTGSWLPIGGMTSANFGELGPIQKALDVGKHLIVPTIVLGTAVMAQLTRIMRSSMLSVLNQQYILTALAKGQSRRKVVYRHALRNAINPMITIFGFQLGEIMSGAALVEQVLGWPGLGQLILQAVLSQDLYLVVGSLIYGVVLLMLGNLLADILLGVTDPRVRVS
jgi:peptide/nickel transport system permease protein